MTKCNIIVKYIYLNVRQKCACRSVHQFCANNDVPYLKAECLRAWIVLLKKKEKKKRRTDNRWKSRTRPRPIRRAYMFMLCDIACSDYSRIWLLIWISNFDIFLQKRALYDVALMMYCSLQSRNCFFEWLSIDSIASEQ